MPPPGPELPDLGPKYQMLQLLGRGGMGAVYEAEHVALRRIVAIKRLAPGFGSSERAVERLRREAESASRIGHPNIVQVVDFDTAPDGLPFVVMERLEGEDLRQRLDARGRLSPPDAVAVIADVCAALSAAHAHGILHRDVKPENVFIARTPDGREVVKLLDFGLALMQEGQKLTVDGEFVGTPAYLAPEQIKGERATERTDVHAVAAVTYECLSGKSPFLVEGLASTLARILEHDPPAPTQAGARPEARPLDRVVLKGLEKNPADRWATPDAFASALRGALAGERIEGVSGVSWRRLRRSRALRAVVAALVVLVLAGGGALLGRGRDPMTREEADRLLARIDTKGEDLNEVLTGELLARQAVRGAPDHAAAHRVLSKVLLDKALLSEKGRVASLRASAREIDEALALDPTDEHAHAIASVVLFALVRDFESLRETAWLERHARSEREKVAAILNRARIAWRTGQSDVVARELDRCLALEPQQGECLEIQVRERSIADGKAAFERLVADRDTDAHVVLFGRIRARLLVGRTEEAAIAFAGGLRGAGMIDPLDRRYFEGMIALGRGDRARALRELEDLERLARSDDLVPTSRIAACWQTAELAALLGDDERVVRWATEGVARGLFADEYWRSFYLFEDARRDGRLLRIAEQARRRGDALWAQARREGIVE